MQAPSTASSPKKWYEAGKARRQISRHRPDGAHHDDHNSNEVNTNFQVVFSAFKELGSIVP
jgi:hypothetical protein